LVGEPQWTVVGDTFPVGCKFEDSNVFPEFFETNPDNSDPRYNTKLGMYKEHCGFKNVHFSFGHDEYMYQVCKFNKCTIPDEGLAMLRFHSFYPWHRGKGYKHLEDEVDRTNLEWVLKFNKFDLYSKSTDRPSVEELKPYYEKIIAKYCPGKLKW